jgi:hypothetical protein
MYVSAVWFSFSLPRHAFGWGAIARPVGQLFHLFEVLVEGNTTELNVHSPPADTTGQLAVQASAGYDVPPLENEHDDAQAQFKLTYILEASVTKDTDVKLKINDEAKQVMLRKNGVSI